MQECRVFGGNVRNSLAKHDSRASHPESVNVSPISTSPRMKRTSAKSSPASAKPTVHAPVPRKPSRGLWISLAVGTIALMMVTALAADWYIGVPDGAQATYVGRNSCIE